MKNLWYFTLPCFFIALTSLLLPFIEFGDPNEPHTLLGYQYAFVDIAVGIVSIISLTSLVKRSINISLLGLMFSLANLFFTLFLIIVIPVYNAGDTMDYSELGSGAFVLLTIAPCLVILSALDTYKSYKKKSI